MAAIREIVREWADEIRDGIAWVIIWKNSRSWNAQAVWLNPDTDTFEPEDMTLARKILVQDPNAVMLNGYYCGHLGENMTIAELTAGICWHYENGYNMLRDSTEFSQKSKEDSKENIEQKQEIEKTARTLLKVHEDVITVPEAIEKMMNEYAAEGNQVKRLSPMNFKIILQNGWVHIYWEDGMIWQKIIEEDKMVAEKPEKVKNGCEANLPISEDDMAEAADNKGQQEAKQSPNGADILDELIVEIIPLLIRGIAKAWQVPEYGGLELATQDRVMYEAVKKLQQRRDACNEKTGEFASYEKCYKDNARGRSG